MNRGLDQYTEWTVYFKGCVKILKYRVGLRSVFMLKLLFFWWKFVTLRFGRSLELIEVVLMSTHNLRQAVIISLKKKKTTKKKHDFF